MIILRELIIESIPSNKRTNGKRIRFRITLLPFQKLETTETAEVEEEELGGLSLSDPPMGDSMLGNA